jgi:hypothetical protein
MWSKPGSETQRPHDFSYTWKIDPKDKHIYKNKHDHIQTDVEHIWNSGIPYGTGGKREIRGE